MIRTVSRQAVTTGQVIVWDEGSPLNTADWTPSIHMSVTSFITGIEGAPTILPPSWITAKSTTGFTYVVDGVVNGTVRIEGLVSDGQGADYGSLADNAIVTVNEFKDYINKPTDDTADDTIIIALINACSDAIERQVRSKVRLSHDTFVLNGSGSDVLRLPQTCRPVDSVYSNIHGRSPSQAIRCRATPLDTFDEFLTQDEQILLDDADRSFIRLWDAVFTQGILNIEVEMSCGYSSTPAAITKVCLEAVAESYAESKHGQGRLGVTSISGSVESMSGNISFKGLADRHIEALAPFTYYT